MKLKDLFHQNPNIIINTDIDGILSGVILVKYLDCKIVGFTNSKDTVWLADGFDDLYKHVYIDMFVTEPKALCLDQHIVAVNEEHQKEIIKSATKFSPQIDGNRIFTDWGFKFKYPFGTVQYLIAVLESEGIKIELPPLNTPIPNSSIKVGDIIHRADDAMKSTMYAYKENATKWWGWLKDKSRDARVIIDLIDYLEAIHEDIEPDEGKRNTEEYKKKLEKYVEVIKASTKKYFSDNFSCRTGDGGFKNIVDEKGNLLSNILDYIKTIGSILDCKEITIPSHFISHKGKYCRTRWLDIFEKDFLNDYTICGHKVFSYAFIYGPGNDSTTNFSFTIDME
jgi:hypothetical protein